MVVPFLASFLAFFFFQAEDGIRDVAVTGVQTCALPISLVSVAVKEIFDAMTLANFFRFPMIFLCGIFIPVSVLPSFLHPLAYVFPLTFSVDLVRYFITGSYDLVHPAVCVTVLIIYSIVLFYLSVW